ncbi:MAG: aminomethyl-transferring glycine dehydrogenase subunit GcvPA [Actinomycetota bacterium]
MDYTPHTEADVAQMLEVIGVDRVEDLFEPIPEDLRLNRKLELPEPLSESEVHGLLSSVAADNLAADSLVCFAGGGAYDHYIPACVRACAGRSEFMTSYTPYQPELSQGVLGALFDYQSMICELTGMEMAVSGLYDGAAALNEALRLAASVTKRGKVVVSEAINPNYRHLLDTLGASLDFEFVTAPATDGVTTFGDAAGAACVVVSQTNFFGCLEDVEAAAEVAHAAGALLVVQFDPLAMGLLESPGTLGADVVVGEGQCLGNDLNYGGPYLGIFATHLKHQRRIPGRISGATADVDGKPGFVLTLQTREQHIRRERATSNVCTDQTLMAVTAAVYMGWLGPQGLEELGRSCVGMTHYTADVLSQLPGCRVRFDKPFFREFVLELPAAAAGVVGHLAEEGFLVGPSLEAFEAMDNCALVAVTERRTVDEIDRLAQALRTVLA